MRAARLLAILLTLAAILAALFYVFRLPLAGWAVRSAMAGAGLENPEARVTALSFSGARLEDVAAGPELAPDFSFEAIEADFHLRRLWTEKKADALRAGPGVARVRIDDAGRVSFAGFDEGGESGGGGAALPFDRLLLRDLKVFILAPDTNARANIDAEYDIGEGGKGAVTLEAERFVWRDIHFSEVDGSASADLSVDGQMSLAADLKAASVGMEGALANNLNIKLDGAASDWRDAANGKADALAGQLRLDFSAPEIELKEAAAQSIMGAVPVEAVLGTALRRAALDGAVIIDFSQGAVTARLAGETPLILATPEGASLAVTQQGEAPFYNASGGRTASSFGFTLESDGVDASGGVDFMSEGKEWRLAAPVEIAEFSSVPLSLAGSRVDLSATSDGAIIDAELGLKSGLKRLDVGRLTISDAPFSGVFGITADMDARRATIVSKSDCFTIERGRGAIKTQNLETRISAMTLCNGVGPLGVATWNGETVFSLAGELAAKTAMFRMGETRAEGRPPAIRIDASYRPNEQKTEIKGATEGGAMTLNDALDMAGVVGRFDFVLDAETLRASANVDRLRIGHHLDKGQTQLVAPVIAAGEASLEGGKSHFAYTVTTPEGRPLGSGEGVHDMMTASGDTVFSLNNLVFAPNGLQPNKVVPALLGIVDEAAGDMDGTVRFGWSPDNVESSAEFDLKNISFNGPTRAVTRTSAVGGGVRLANLLPLTTDGLQTIEVGGVDMDALQLGLGVITFELPGDDSIHLAKAEFPWFGGTIGVYDAKAAFTGEAVIPLRADNADLAKILDYVDVEGLSGEGVLSGELPIIFEDGRARIENGYFKSEGPGVLRYKGKASDAAGATNEEAKVAFDLLRDLEYRSMIVTVNGPLDGRLDFVIELEGTGEVSVRNQAMVRESKGRVPVIYTISLDAPLIALLNQANLTRNIGLQIERAQRGDQ